MMYYAEPDDTLGLGWTVIYDDGETERYVYFFLPMTEAEARERADRLNRNLKEDTGQ